MIGDIIPLLLPANYYYIGLIGVDHDPNMRQSLSLWNLEQPALHRFSFALVSTHLQYFAHFATDPLISDTVTSPPGSTSLTIHKTPLPAHLGFTTSFTWAPTFCERAGFSFFLTKTGLSEVVQASDEETGRLGTAALSGVTSISYMSTTNELKAFFKYELNFVSKI